MKNKFLLLVLSVLLTHVLHAAKDSTKVKSFKRLYLGVSVTGNITYRYISQNYIPQGSSAAAERAVRDTRNSREKPLAGFQLGGRFGINIRRFVSIETGADYTRHRYYGDVSYTLVSGGQTFRTRTIADYNYWNVPLALNFMLGKHKFRGLISTGVNFNILAKKINIYRNYTDENFTSRTVSDDTRSFSQFNVSPFLGIGIDWQILNFLSLRVMPVVQMQALENINTPITERLWSAGVNAGLNFGFVKVK